MPKSPIRRKSVFTPPPTKRVDAVRIGNPRWLVPLMLALFVVGLLWVVVFYLTQQKYPIEAIHNFNMLVGFGLIIGGFILATRWK